MLKRHLRLTYWSPQMSWLPAAVSLMCSDVFYSAEQAALSGLGQPSCTPVVIEIDGGLDEPETQGQATRQWEQLEL